MKISDSGLSNHHAMRIAGCATLVSGLLAACATTSPTTVPALSDAHAAVQRLFDPMAREAAGKPLEDARAALAKADDANAKHESADEILHWSYMASRNADIGQAALREHRARAEMQQAQSQRDQMLLAKREQEADQAKAQLQAMNSQNPQWRHNWRLCKLNRPTGVWC